MSECNNEIFSQEAGLVCSKTIEIVKLQAQLDSAIEVIEFYGDYDNWEKHNHVSFTLIRNTDRGFDRIAAHGGKRARKWLRDNNNE